MKHLGFRLALMGAALLLAAACGKDGNTSGFPVSNISSTPCKIYVDIDSKADPMWGAPDSVSVEYDQGTVYITHYNVLINCAFELTGVLVDVAVDGSTVTISEHENPNGPLANCMCATDNSFQLDDVPHGTYTLVFTNWYPEPYSETFKF